MAPIRQKLSDGAAIATSLVCLVHCLALPVLIALLPAAATYVALPESFHLLALSIALPTSVIALTIGFRRHRRISLAVTGAIGLALLAVGATLAPNDTMEIALTTSGALLLAISHTLNWKALRA